MAKRPTRPQQERTTDYQHSQEAVQRADAWQGAVNASTSAAGRPAEGISWPVEADSILSLANSAAHGADITTIPAQNSRLELVEAA